MREIARGLLQRLGVALPPDAPVGSLSIAERQVVAICRGLAADAKLLFMDEPTASLTRAEVKALLGFVERLRSEGVAVVFVSHRLDEVVEIAERVTVMRDGRKVGTYAAGEVDARRHRRADDRLVIDQAISARDVGEATPLLEVRGLTRLGEYQDVTFTLRRGEVLGLTGLLGAGRTELALTLFGMTRPDSGEIRLEGSPITVSSNQDAIAAGIAYVSEDRLNLGLNMRQSVGDNLVLASLNRLANDLGWIMPQRRRALAGEWVDRLHIKIPGLDNPVQQLSGGNQQRVVLGKWLATAPKVLILDSPYRGRRHRQQARHLRAGAQPRRQRGGHSADLRRGPGGATTTAIACCTCATGGSLARSFPGASASTSSRSGSMRERLGRLDASTPKGCCCS